MHSEGTCPAWGAEGRKERGLTPFVDEGEPLRDGPMLLARTLNGTPWREEWRADRAPAEPGIDLSWLKW